MGTNRGFKICTSFPYKKLFQRNIGPIGIIEMLYRTNLLVYVRALKKEPFLEEKVVIFDDQSNKSVGDLTFKSPICSLKISKQ